MTAFKFISTITLLALVVQAGAQQVEKNFAKSFNVEGKSSVILDLPGEVDLRFWDSNILRVEMNISIPGNNANLINQLADAGRYDAKSTSTPDEMTIHLPNMNRQVRIKGEELKETLAFTVYAPRSVKITGASPTLAEAKKM